MIKMIIKCEICKKDFEAQRSTRKYCNECAIKIKKQKDLLNSREVRKNLQSHYVKTCNNCNKEFETVKKNQLYCSKKCYKENQINLSALRYKKYGVHHKQLHYKTCPICRIEFETTNNKKIYCSKTCKYKANYDKK